MFLLNLANMLSITRGQILLIYKHMISNQKQHLWKMWDCVGIQTLQWLYLHLLARTFLWNLMWINKPQSNENRNVMKRYFDFNIQKEILIANLIKDSLEQVLLCDKYLQVAWQSCGPLPRHFLCVEHSEPIRQHRVLQEWGNRLVISIIYL